MNTDQNIRNIVGGRGGRSSRGGRTGPAFTLVEVVFVMTIVIVLMSLTAVVVGRAIRSARESSERQFVGSLRIGVEQFKNTFGFLPPLLEDGSFGVIGGEALQNQGLARYSTVSLPVYLLGSMPRGIDGYAGFGQGRPREDGTWDRGAPRNDPFFDLSRDSTRLRPFGPYSQLVDRWGTPVRYYRWEPTLEPKFDEGVLNPAAGEIKSANIPAALFDASEDNWGERLNSGAGMRSGSFAIVSAGPDGVIFGGPSSNAAWKALNKDNIVEVGR